jgi:hypothetical protein
VLLAQVVPEAGRKDETCPLSTGGRMRRVQLVRGEGGGRPPLLQLSEPVHLHTRPPALSAPAAAAARAPRARGTAPGAFVLRTNTARRGRRRVRARPTCASPCRGFMTARTSVRSKFRFKFSAPPGAARPRAPRSSGTGLGDSASRDGSPCDGLPAPRRAPSAPPRGGVRRRALGPTARAPGSRSAPGESARGA